MRLSGLVTLLLLAVSSVPAAAGGLGGTPAAVGQVRVFDSNGNDIGTFLGWPAGVGGIGILRGHGLLLHVSRVSGQLLNFDAFIFFEGPNCTGQGWIQAPFDVWLEGPVFSPGQFVIGDAPAQTQTITFQSRTIEPLFLCENITGQRTDDLAPLKFISEDELGFSLPFAGPLKIERSIRHRPE